MKRPVGAFAITLGFILGLSLFLTAALGAAPSRAANNPFSEVPLSHWSYGALERMAELKLSDRRFDGITQLGYRLTRLDMALETALILDKLASRISEGAQTLNSPLLSQSTSGSLGTVASLIDNYNAVVAADERISDADRALLIDLVYYFYLDLEALGYRVETVAGPVRAVGIDTLGRSLGQWHVTAEGMYQLASYTRVQAGAPRAADASVSHEYTLDLGYAANDFLLEAIIHTSSTLSLLQRHNSDASISLSLLEFTFRDRLVARIGELSTAQWDELTVAPVQSLHGVQAGINLGTLGSKVLVAQGAETGENAYLAGLDGTLHLDRLTLGANLIHMTSGVDPASQSSGTLASVQGRYTLSPGWVISAGLAGSVWDAQELGAALHLIGEFDLGEERTLVATYRLTDRDFRRAFASTDDGGRSEFDLSLGLGGALLTAGIGRVEDGGDGVSTTRSLGVSLAGYQVMDAAVVVRASREETTRSGSFLQGMPGSESHVTALGIDFVLPQFNVTLGYELEDVPRQGQLRTTGMGVDFEAMGGSISLNYSVIDSAGLIGNYEETLTTAEFSIRF